MIKNSESEIALTSEISCSPSCSLYCQMDREVPSRKTDKNLSSRPVNHSVQYHNLRSSNNSSSMKYASLLENLLENIADERRCKRKPRTPCAKLRILRLSSFLLRLVLILFALIMSRVTADCGCGSRCENYTEDVQCTRCCTATVRRSISPESYPSMNKVNEELRKDSISRVMEKDYVARKTLFPVRPLKTLNAERNGDSDSGKHQPELLRRLFDLKIDRQGRQSDESVKKEQLPATSPLLSLFPGASSPMILTTFYRQHHPLSAAESRRTSVMAENVIASPDHVARIVEQLQRRDQINNYLKTHKQLRIRKHLYNSIYRYLQIQREGAKNMK